MFGRKPTDEIDADAPASAAPTLPDADVLLREEESAWTNDFAVVGRKLLPPDSRMMQAIGRNHSFDSAVADIVDNSLDAGATKILVRFVRDRDQLVGVFIVDNGHGMDDIAIDRAMTFGGKRTYGAKDLGHFGVGLKAASLGQARSLTVVARARAGRPVARRLLAEASASGFECDVLSEEYAASMLERKWGHVVPETGTIVVWNDVKTFPKVVLHGTVDALLDEMTTRLCRHLGLVFHRIITATAVEIVIDQEDVGVDELGVPFSVKPIDPFGYGRSGRADYPRLLSASTDAGSLAFRCHIWPGRSNDPNFKLPGGRPDQFQGFFVYRNDRLIQHGGWHQVTSRKDDLQLARVEVDMLEMSDGLFEINPEKTQVGLTDRFTALVNAAADGDASFSRYLEDATQAYRESRKRTRQRPKVVAPGAGFAPAIKDAIEDEFDFIEARQPLEIRWGDVEGDLFFEVDKEQKSIRLNRRYRASVIGAGRASLNDAPLVKAFMFLLAESALRGDVIGPRDKDNLAIWQAVLTAAAQAESE